jgi:hypothetical protein
MAKRRKRSRATIQSARRKLINKALRLCQLELFTDKSPAAAQALAELKSGLAAFEAELRELDRAR